ncbi:hypothetical protein [Ferrovum sp.]|uniref:hypothetical protein n=1 Tax=Ferrovum sp. TaxID=2609467 RepID=UPI002625A402|nr:hypothetical protein [Ferrovum sp.]
MSKIHLTHTGYWAGKTLCESVREEGDSYVHAVYAPLTNDEWRKKVCPECLKLYAELAYEDEDLETAPQWVIASRAGIGLGSH